MTRCCVPDLVRVALILGGCLGATPAVAARELCFSYAPMVTEVIGVLQREAFEPQPIEDLNVDPDDVEVEGTPPWDRLPPTVGSGGLPAGIAAGISASPPADPANVGPVPPQASSSPQAADRAPQPPPVASLIPPPTPAPHPAYGPFPPPAPAENSPPAPPWPGEAIGPPPPPAGASGPDQVLMQARPVKRPLPKDRVWVLSLPKPICVRADADDLINVSENKIKKLQLVVEADSEAVLGHLIKKRVVVRGQLFHSTSRRHYFPVLMNVEDLRPPEWVQDTTQRPPPP